MRAIKTAELIPSSSGLRGDAHGNNFMNRRNFLSLTILSPFIRMIKPEDLFFDMNKLKGVIPNENLLWDCNLNGIPYHQSDGTTGTWLGFERK